MNATIQFDNNTIIITTLPSSLSPSLFFLLSSPFLFPLLHYRPGIYRPMKHYNKLLSEREEMVGNESQASLASLSDTITNNVHYQPGQGEGESSSTMIDSGGNGMTTTENGTKSFTIGEGCVIGMHILLGKIGSARGWVWIDAKVDGKPYVGGMPPVTGRYLFESTSSLHLPSLTPSILTPYYS